MAEVNKNVVPLLFFLSFAVIIPTLHAHIAEFDDYWKLRAEQARKDALEAYHPQPEEITNNFNSHVNKDLIGNNSTRRQLRKYKGPCLATNPIDRCWRCDPIGTITARS